MKKIYISICIVLTLVLSAFTLPVATANDTQTVDLWADGGSEATAFKVGYIEVWDDGSNLYIKFHISGDYSEWEMTYAHIHLGWDLDDFPLTKKGNPQVGKFDHHYLYTTPLTYPNTDTVTIPYNGETMIAVQAEVQTICGYEGDIAGIEANLPDQATFSVTYPVGGGPAYFPHTYITGIDGVSDIYSWCVDTDHVIYQGTTYTANVYSSLESIPAGYIEYPENLDKVDWILSQHFVGTASPGCSGVYTYGDVQRAIWALVEDTQSTSGLGSWSQCRVDEILAGADANGEGFVPGCGDVIGIVLVPVDGQQVLIAQAIVGEIEVPCITIYCGETAWAGDLGINEFTPGMSWAMYFDYVDCEFGSVTKEYQFGKVVQLLLDKLTKILVKLRAI